jgi:hypothetical protein
MKTGLFFSTLLIYVIDRLIITPQYIYNYTRNILSKVLKVQAYYLVIVGSIANLTPDPLPYPVTVLNVPSNFTLFHHPYYF